MAAGVIQLNEALDVLSFPSYWNKGVELLNCAIISSKAGKDKETWYVCFSETDELEEWTEEMQQYHAELIWTHDTRSRVVDSSDESESESEEEDDEVAPRGRSRRGRTNMVPSKP